MIICNLLYYICSSEFIVLELKLELGWVRTLQEQWLELITHFSHLFGLTFWSEAPILITRILHSWDFPYFAIARSPDVCRATPRLYLYEIYFCGWYSHIEHSIEPRKPRIILSPGYSFSCKKMSGFRDQRCISICIYSRTFKLHNPSIAFIFWNASISNSNLKTQVYKWIKTPMNGVG